MRIIILLERDTVTRLLERAALDELRGMGDLTFPDDLNDLGENQLCELICGHDIVVTGWGSPELPVSALHQRSSRLGYVCHLTGEMRHCIPPEYVLSDSIVVTNWGTAVSGFVAETALALMLACSRRLRRHFESMVMKRGWKEASPLSSSLFSKRIGLYGLGNIAKKLVDLLASFQPVLSYYDPYAANDTPHDIEKLDNLRDLFSRNDIVSVHAAQTPETVGSVNREMLELMPPDAILVNTARGAIINEQDLLKVLEYQDFWVGLDVFQAEPLPAESLLRDNDKVVLTPHIGGKTGADQIRAISRVAVSNIRSYIDGKPLSFVVTEDEYGKIT